ncbi:hypothetical protein G7013_06255 [Pseudomonas viridiflava]|uniref:hypothetical protein n=1 Tax=Pseudomonas viridiflava TaxID=33069 RepID=UPI0015E31063|nr:hypothetical protein [Pseudomonas viridiflava]MBA1229246.1 hypothetical protein [Pseudomonas viridiflava]
MTNMTQKTKIAVETETQATDQSKRSVSKSKTCFVIMPIADMEGYEKGHFLRVYEHLIKPACESAGFEPHRADFVASSNYIIIDILRKILDSDLVICDLSGRNPNVLYELGVRQAFNLPTVLIKDAKTPKIFDIQGLRYTEYGDALRIDEVEKGREQIKSAIVATDENPGVNSMIQLLGVTSAPLPHKVELSEETNVIMESLKDISIRISRIESYNASPPTPLPPIVVGNFPDNLRNRLVSFNNEHFRIGDELFLDGKSIGSLLSVASSHVAIKQKNNTVRIIEMTDPSFAKISGTPF